MTHDLIPLVSSEDEAAWHAIRARGVTASEVHRIVTGGRRQWRRILDDKLNGSTFKGNRHTRRGHEREPFLIAFAADKELHDLTPNKHLFAHPEWPRFMATPDGLSFAGLCGIEVKSHDHGWERADIPADHYDQMQFGMLVTGYDRWLYVWEVMGPDGEPTLDDPELRWVERDEARIAQIVEAVDAFLAWWDSGAPEVDDIPDVLDDALAAHADASARKTAAEADEKAAEKTIREHIANTPGASDGLKLAGSRASFNYSVTYADVLDEEAWAQAEPESFAAYLDLKQRLAATASAALELYHRAVPKTRLTITANKEAA